MTGSINSRFQPHSPDTPRHTTDRLTHCQAPFISKHARGRKQPPQNTVSIPLPAPNSLVLVIPSPCLDKYCNSHLGSDIPHLVLPPPYQRTKGNSCSVTDLLPQPSCRSNCLLWDWDRNMASGLPALGEPRALAAWLAEPGLDP